MFAVSFALARNRLDRRNNKNLLNVIAQTTVPSVTVRIMLLSNFGNGGRIATPALANAPSTKRMESMNVTLAHLSEKRTDFTDRPMYESWMGKAASAPAMMVEIAKKNESELNTMNDKMLQWPSIATNCSYVFGGAGYGCGNR